MYRPESFEETSASSLPSEGSRDSSEALLTFHLKCPFSEGISVQCASPFLRKVVQWQETILDRILCKRGDGNYRLFL